MDQVKLAAGVLNQTPLAWDQNLANIRSAISQAQAEGVGVLCLPELCITGYGCEDAFLSPGVWRMAAEVLQEIASIAHGIVVSVGLPVEYDGQLYNAACLIANQEILGLVGKQNLAGQGLHYEPRWFKPWPNDACVEVSLGQGRVPLGDLVFDVGGLRIGFEICEDAWVAHRPGMELAQQGVDVLLNPSASHFAFGKHKVREQLVLVGSRSFHASYVYANLLGNEAGRAIYDGDAMIASCGQLIACGKRFSYEDVLLTTAVVDVQRTRAARAKVQAASASKSDSTAHVVRAPFTFPPQSKTPPAAQHEEWETDSHVKEEEFTRAIGLGLFDYMRKSRARGFVVSLSGGADSSAVATLCATMVTLAVQELGEKGVCQKLAYIPKLAQANDVRDMVRQLLTCVYQSTRNSGAVTREAARSVAEGVGAVHYELDVDAIVQAYVAGVSELVGRELTWQQDDVPLQNIQARVRGPSVWLLANLNRALLLATSNRSEAAVGYATMDGDTCGGLSPIAGIDKAFLRRWLRWMEVEGPQNVGPHPFLAPVNVQQPTAELRPPAAGQTDEGDLMPYELLDAIERAAIRDKRTPWEVFLQMETQFGEIPAAQLADYVERFFRLWCRNQWKRERYAPSFHLDDENLDPKTWCRFPILSGGYERELRQLRSNLAARAGS